MTTPGAQLAAFAANLRFANIPASVVRKTEDLLVDWFGSTVAGHGSRPVDSITRFALSMGPQSGPSEVIVNRASTSPYLAAMANAAASHVAEQDDVHNGSVFHPATVVFPAAVAVAQALGASGQQLLTASVAGYEVGIRVGEFLGRSHYKIFHTTGTAGTLAFAAAVGHLLGLDAAQMQHAFGSAGTQAADLWEFLRTAADSKQLHTARAAAAGLKAAYLAKDGFTGAAKILEGPQGMAAGMSSDANPAKLTDRLGTRWATAETSFKFHASCRHTHPAADALLQVIQVHGLQPEDLVRVVTHVHQGAIDVLGPVVRPVTVHQSKFSMGTVLALVSRFGRAGLVEFDQHFVDDSTQALRDRVTMQLDAEVDAAYPQRWIGKVTVHTTDGRVLHGRVDEPKGDPGNTLSREEITAKALRLAAFSGGATAPEMQAAVDALWGVAACGCVAGGSPMIASARSFLFVPANRSERFVKALASGADAVIIDLEDAVSPADKPAARTQLAQGFTSLAPADRARIVVRMNALGTPFHDDDLVLLASLVAQGLGGVMVPKAKTLAGLQRVVDAWGPAAPCCP